VALLLAAVAMNMLWWALPMLLAFSAGLAVVLIVIGVLVVHTRALAGSRWEKSRVFRALPLVSALLVTGLGLWLCYGSLRR
jgi:ABC-type nickel/cobalt efflux system permease component RcnA